VRPMVGCATLRRGRPMHPFDVLRRPVVTEKVTRQTADGQYTFEVALDATKIQIKEAVEMAFSVNVVRVNTSRLMGKRRRQGKHFGMTPTWKKAIVTIQPGQNIEFFEVV
jgi:large subunit ribosomal protein L23